MKAVLINAPVSKQSPHSRLAPPLGLASIGAALLQAGFEVSAIDFNISGLNLMRVERMITRDNPAIIGISAHTETYLNALKIAQKVKERNPEVKVILGGPHPSIMPEAVLAEEHVDFIAVGEGEGTMLELMQFLSSGKPSSLSEIKGLGYKKANGELRINERRPLLDPNTLPIPARELFPLDFYKDRWNVMAARGGCPFRCPFCSASYIWNGKRRARKPENIIAEIKLLVEQYGAEYIFFSDDIFTLNKEWVYEILNRLKALPYQVEWGCSTRVDMVTPELLRKMAESGCRAIQYGVESGCQKILDSVKGIKKEQVLVAVKAAIEVGIDVASSFMIPFPEDTVETIRETKEFIKEVYQAGSKVLLSFTSPYPGTYFYENAEVLGLKILTNNWEEFDAKHNVLETKYLSSKQIEDLVHEIVREVGLKRSC